MVNAQPRVLWFLLGLILHLLAPFTALADRGPPDKPAGLDDAGWVSLQDAVEKSIGRQVKLTAGSTAGADGAAVDVFGYSVALSGDTALVGTPQDDVVANINQGSAYVFVRSGISWTLQAKLLADDGKLDDYFGRSVALSGDTAIIGAPEDDVGGNTNQGSAYVFTRSGTVWTQQAQLLVGGGTWLGEFGIAVAVSGDTALVGAHRVGAGATQVSGSAYVFTRNGSTWTQQAQLVASDAAQNDAFGGSVALSGDTALVGAHGDDVGANADQGSAYVFTRSGGSWTQHSKLLAGAGAASDLFGWAVALSGDTALIGSFGASFNRGSAYVFTRSGSSWTQQAQLLAGDGAAHDWFGYSVALSGDTALVGAPAENRAGSGKQGWTYVFTRSGINWTQQAKLLAGDGAADDRFGGSVALFGDTVLVGAFGDDVGANEAQGSAYEFVRSGNNWMQQSLLTAGGGTASDGFGTSVALFADTALVGVPWNDIGANTDQGSAYVFTRSGSSWTLQAQLLAGDGAATDLFGGSVALYGDTALVGAIWDDVGTDGNQGSAYVFTRNGAFWTQQAQLLAGDGATGDEFGISVALSGDTALVGAHADEVGANRAQGSAYVFTRSGTTWAQQAQLTALDGAGFDRFGGSVAMSGDTALVGAQFDQVGAISAQGSAYVFTRSGTTWTQQGQLTALDGAGSDRFGNSVALHGDTALVGAYGDDVGANSNQGSAYVFTRSGTVWTQQAQLLVGDSAANEGFGWSVALSADTALVGASYGDVGVNEDQGSAYVFSRSGISWAQQSKLLAGDGAAYDFFGGAVALSEHFALIGASSANGAPPFGNPNEGAAYMFVTDDLLADGFE